MGEYPGLCVRSMHAVTTQCTRSAHAVQQLGPGIKMIFVTSLTSVNARLQRQMLCFVHMSFTSFNSHVFPHFLSVYFSADRLFLLSF